MSEQQPPYPSPDTYGRPKPDAETEQDTRPEGDQIKCPECGETITGKPAREKHALYHYGDDLIPPYPDNNLAAERKAALLGVDPSTLRGFSRRR